MILVDSRAGSSDFYPVLKSLGLDTTLTMMPFGDVAWVGVGPDQMPVNVGVEIKKLDDALACLTSGRMAAHQLPGMIKSYDHVYFLLIGEYRARVRDGVMEQRRSHRDGRGEYWCESGGGQRRWMWRDFESWLLSMTIMGGMRLIKEPTVESAAQYLKVLYNWYQKDEHKSHLAMYTSKDLYSDSALLVKPPLVRRIAAELPQIGLSRSADVARVFKTVYDLAEAREDQWMDLTVDGGKRLGVRGSAVYNAIRGHVGKNGRGGDR